MRNHVQHQHCHPRQQGRDQSGEMLPAKHCIWNIRHTATLCQTHGWQQLLLIHKWKSMDKPAVGDKAIFCHFRWLLSGKTMYLEPELWKVGVKLVWHGLIFQTNNKPKGHNNKLGQPVPVPGKWDICWTSLGRLTDVECWSCPLKINTKSCLPLSQTATHLHTFIYSLIFLQFNIEVGCDSTPFL